MPSTISPSSAPSGEDEDESMESESKEADQIGEGAKNCTMPGMDMSEKKDMANGGMKGGATASPTKAMMNNGNMGMRMTKANCTDQPMGGMRRGGGNNMRPSTMMMNERGKMQSAMTTPKGRRN
ncbi:uncharacterized protein LOC119396102 [Rhipicephalus sanguineus]|uniref:uncharacterized protein LOC119396102 n=1 Tax=Rhipicephalus sanguineus TaxID=34632 RepID=UPI001895BD8A|nr:uncharacterized protein LOC119396102 [Rhipicephalus sanguineus]